MILEGSSDLFDILVAPLSCVILPKELQFKKINPNVLPNRKPFHQIICWLVSKLRHLVPEHRIVVDNVFKRQYPAEMDDIKQPVADSDLALHYEKHLEDLLVLPLNDIFHIVIPRF